MLSYPISFYATLLFLASKIGLEFCLISICFGANIIFVSVQLLSPSPSQIVAVCLADILPFRFLLMLNYSSMRFSLTNICALQIVSSTLVTTPNFFGFLSPHFQHCSSNFLQFCPLLIHHSLADFTSEKIT